MLDLVFDQVGSDALIIVHLDALFLEECEDCADRVKEGVPLSKWLFIFALLLTLEGTLYAEAGGNTKRLGLTLFGGFSFNSHSSSGNTGGINSSTGMAFGFGIDYKLLPWFGIEIDMLDIWKSYERTFNNTVEKNNLSFLEIPFLLRVYPSKNVSFKMGPYLAAFIMQAERESQGSVGSVKGEYRNDFGMTFGSWFGFNPTPTVAVGIDLRYDLGLNNILNDHQPQLNINTRTFMSMLNVTFQFK